MYFVTDEEDLTADVLCRHVATLAPHYGGEEIPLLVYPSLYAESHSIPYEKTYITYGPSTARYTDRYYEVHGKIIAGRRSRGEGGSPFLATTARESFRSASIPNESNKTE